MNVPIFRICSVLASFAQQLLRSTALPGVREIGPRRRPHIDVRVAVLAHDLASTAEDPHHEGTLAATGRLFDRVGAYFQHVRGKFETDQVATCKQCVAIGLLVDVMPWHMLASRARLIRGFQRLEPAGHPPQAATGSTSIVPPQSSQRGSLAGAVAPSLDLPQAMQYTRNTVRAALRAAARSSAEGSSIKSNEARSDLRDCVPDSFAADSAIMRQSSRPWTEIPFQRSRAASPATTQRLSSSQRICSRSGRSGDLYRDVLAFCEGAVSQAGTSPVYAPCFGPARDM
jgi:hypothetical protein